MRHILLFSLAMTMLSFFSKGQTANTQLYDESNYVHAGQDFGPENSDEPYVIWYKASQDVTYTLKKVFLDSSRTQLIAKYFYKDNLLDGPFYGYLNSLLSIQGTYKQGKLHGERLTYREQKLVQRAFFTDGVRSGSWEEFDAQGKLIRKITFNQFGYVTADINY